MLDTRPEASSKRSSDVTFELAGRVPHAISGVTVARYYRGEPESI